MLVSPVRWGNGLATPLAAMSEGEVWKRLLGHALRVFAEFGFFGADRVVPGFGKSAEDYAQTVYISYVLGQTKAKELAYLCTTIRNDIIDDLRSPLHKLTESRANLTENR